LTAEPQLIILHPSCFGYSSLLFQHNHSVTSDEGRDDGKVLALAPSKEWNRNLGNLKSSGASRSCKENHQ
jgi:hypothetical protein